MKRTLTVMATIVALAVLAPAVRVEAHASPSRSFHLDKTCTDDPSEPLGYFCTVQHSDSTLIPAGTEIHYAAGPTDDVVLATITTRNGSTTGACVWSTDVNAVCSFEAGTGRLAGFHLKVDVTANADQSVWFWDGIAWFGDSHDDHGRD
jgi:hypothetical protein